MFQLSFVDSEQFMKISPKNREKDGQDRKNKNFFEARKLLSINTLTGILAVAHGFTAIFPLTRFRGRIIFTVEVNWGGGEVYGLLTLL